MNAADLPDDPAPLKRLVAERDAAIAERDARLTRQDETIARRDLRILRMEVELLRFRKWYYGRRADDLAHHEDTAQLVLPASKLKSTMLVPVP